MLATAQPFGGTGPALEAWAAAGFRQKFSCLSWAELERDYPAAAEALRVASAQPARRPPSAQYMADHFPATALHLIATGERERAAQPLPDLYGWRRDSRAAASQWAANIAAQMRAASIGRAYDEGQLRAAAADYAQRCGLLPTLAARSGFAAALGVAPPSGRGVTEEGAARRLICERWWRRQLRRAWTRAAEECWRELGEIRRWRQPCASDDATRMVIERGQRYAAWAEQRELVCIDTGETLPMAEVIKGSIALPANRRAEMMVRVRGCGELAMEAGWIGQLVTLTCPSAFHPRLHKSGEPNPRYIGMTVRGAQQWLCRMWARARARLQRLSVQFMGIRTAEPHHDGTPHWHMVVWTPPQHSETFQAVVRGEWLSEYGDEPGAHARRCDFRLADPAKGGEMGLVGYAAKYVAKNIDGAGSIGGETDDETGDTVSESTARKVAWNRVHGIRQFQLIGVAPVGLWRELRRSREEHHAPAIENARRAADAGEWALFTRALGGIERARRRVGCIQEPLRYRLHMPMVRGYRAAKRQRFKVVGYRPLKRQPNPQLVTLVRREWRPWTRLAYDRREAQPTEMPACWITRKVPDHPLHAGWPMSNAYGEGAQPQACGAVGYGLLGRYVSIATRHHRWRIEKCGGGSCLPQAVPPRSVASSATRRAGMTAGVKDIRTASGINAPPPLGGAGGYGSESARAARSDSDLGPVAITVRGSNSAWAQASVGESPPNTDVPKAGPTPGAVTGPGVLSDPWAWLDGGGTLQ